jgi:hypothetical protein
MPQGRRVFTLSQRVAEIELEVAGPPACKLHGQRTIGGFTDRFEAVDVVETPETGAWRRSRPC